MTKQAEKSEYWHYLYNMFIADKPEKEAIRLANWYSDYEYNNI